MTVAFVLSGGGNLGAMQAGSVIALLEAGIEPDLLVGTSVGALNAAFLSTRPGVAGARTLMATWAALGRKETFRCNPLTLVAGILGMHDHMVSDQPLRRFIRRWSQIDRIEQATVPFVAVTTDALTGEAVVIDHGDVVDALMASSAIPGLFPPVRIDGRLSVDGSLSANCPVLQAQALGADDVYVLTTTTAPPPRSPRGALSATIRAAALVNARVERAQLATAVREAADVGGRVIVVPSAEPVAPGIFDFRRGAVLAEVAYERTRTWLEHDVLEATGADFDLELACQSPDASA